MNIKYFKQNGVSRNVVSVSFYMNAENYLKVAEEILDFERKMNEKIKEFEG